MKRKMTKLVSTFASAMMCLPAAVVLAQNADQAGQAANSDANAATSGQATQGNGGAANTGALQEVVVTAERRAVGLQETPIVVSAISEDQMLGLHLENVTDLQLQVPSFQSADQSGSLTSVNIRGIGLTSTGANIEDGVAVIRDGIYFPNPVDVDIPMVDIADTEVLEGPQGTLVGSSSTGGAVIINSANPNFNGFSGYFVAGVGTYSDTKVQGAVNLPVTDTFAVRFAYSAEQRGSFYKNIGGTSEGYFINAAGQPQSLNAYVPGTTSSESDPGHLNDRLLRVKALWKPTDNFQAMGEIEYYFNTTGGIAGEPNPLTYNTLFSGKSTTTGCNAVTGTTFTGTQLVCPLPGAVKNSTFYYPGETPLVLDYFPGEHQYDNTQTRYELELRYTLPGGTVLRSLTGFVDINNPEVDDQSFGPQNDNEYRHLQGYGEKYYNQEVNLISPTTGKFNWILGGFWQYRTLPAYTNTLSFPSPYLPDALPTTQAFQQSPYRSRLGAVFGNISWLFTKTLTLQVGLRENWDANFSSDTYSVAPPVGTVVPEPTGTGTYTINYTNGEPSSYTVIAQQSSTGYYKDSVMTGKVDLSWTPTPGQNFYLFYARGYKPGGVNAGSQDHPTFNPEGVNDFETGWKGRLFDGHLLTQVGLYYDKYQNMQYGLYDTEANRDQSTGNYVANLPMSTFYGVELSEQAQFHGLGINGGVGYGHSALGAVSTVPSYALPPGFGSPTALPQCVAGHTYPTGINCFDYTPYVVNIGGEQNLYAPTWTLDMAVDYKFQVDDSVIDPRVWYTYTDKQWDSIFQNPYDQLGSRDIWNASVDWLAGDWDVQVYGTNITNQIYIGAGGSTVYYGNPRRLGLQLTRKF